MRLTPEPDNLSGSIAPAPDKLLSDTARPGRPSIDLRELSSIDLCPSRFDRRLLDDEALLRQDRVGPTSSWSLLEDNDRFIVLVDSCEVAPRLVAWLESKFFKDDERPILGLSALA